MKITAKLVDLHQSQIFPAEIFIEAGKIRKINRIDNVPPGSGYILPGFVDAHVHIESSMLPPSEFARLALIHGTVATVSDPHEIANVLGRVGIEYMLDDARQAPFNFCFGAPSCVPATSFETSGAELNANDVWKILQISDIGYLSEMMNFPGVLNEDPEVLKKIEIAKKLGKPIDGHAPGLRGNAAKKYFEAGITTDHECFTYEEGLEKAKLGVKIIIREGSAAKNFNQLWPLINQFPEQIMFCSDDKHPNDLVKGHINLLVAKSIANGCDLFDVLRTACLNPVLHYDLPVGLLREGDAADFILVEDLTSFTVRETWINGKQVAKNGQSLIPFVTSSSPNNFKAEPKQPDQFKLASEISSGHIRVIKTLDGEIVTEEITGPATVQNGHLVANPDKDFLKIAVVNRYVKDARPAIGFVMGFGLTKGAIASSVAHDSHNIVAIGTDDQALCEAVNAVIRAKGGISATDGGGKTKVLALPIAGLMSPEDGFTVARQYAELDAWTKETLSCRLQAPFMTLSFLALPVIPALKITDIGLFDVNKFDFVSVQVDA